MEDQELGNSFCVGTPVGSFLEGFRYISPGHLRAIGSLIREIRRQALPLGMFVDNALLQFAKVLRVELSELAERASG
jgi:hypothetical protein